MKQRIDRDVAEGLLPADTDSESLAGLAIAVIQGLSVLARDGADRPQLISIARAAMNSWPQPIQVGEGAKLGLRNE
jgi:hypothetical protein